MALTENAKRSFPGLPWRDPLRGRPKPVKTIRSGLLDRFLIVEDSRCLHFLEICMPVVSPLTACFKLRESPSGLALKVEG